MYISESAMEVQTDNIFIPSFRDEIDHYLAWITLERSSKLHNQENPMNVITQIIIPDQFKTQSNYKLLI